MFLLLEMLSKDNLFIKNIKQYQFHGDFKLCAIYFVFSQVFRKDLISAMKIPDSHHVNPDSYYLFTDTWKEEWEKGVQVPANPDSVPTPSLRYWHVYNFDLGKELSWFSVDFLGRN